MAATTQSKSKTTTASAPQLPAAQGNVILQTEGGRTSIEPHVVAKIAGLAIREVGGVHALVPFGASQALANIAKSVRGQDYRDLGVNVEVGQIEAAIDARIITDYGASIPNVAAGIRQNVGDRILEMTGLKVKEVNIEVVDLWFDEPAPAPTATPTNRVQ